MFKQNSFCCCFINVKWIKLTSFKMSQFSRPWTINSFYFFNSFTNTFCFVFVTFVNWCDISRQILTWQLLNRLLAPGLKNKAAWKQKFSTRMGNWKCLVSYYVRENSKTKKNLLMWYSHMVYWKNHRGKYICYLKDIF